MNVILFERDEVGSSLSRFDPRGEHIVKVLHKQPGESFEAGIIDGPFGTATILGMEDDRIAYRFLPGEEPPALYPLTVIIGFPRPIVLRRLLKDLSTLGVSSIRLAASDTGEKSYLKSTIMKRGAARDALVEGAMQGFTTRLPTLGVYRSVEACLEDLACQAAPAARGGPAGADGGAGKAETGGQPARRDAGGASRVYFDNVAPELRFSRLAGLSAPVVLAIGSERGWSDRERALFRDAGFVAAGLGERVLRTETACTVAVVLALEKLGII